MKSKVRLVLATAAFLAAWSPVMAGDRYYSGNDSFPTTVLVDPSTGKPYAIGGGGGSTPVPLASGTGGWQAATLGTSPTTGFIPAAATNAPRKVIVVTNEASVASGATVTLCLSGGPTPAPNAPGCHTFGPGGSYSAPASGYVPQDGFNAVASVAGTPVTIEIH